MHTQEDMTKHDKKLLSFLPSLITHPFLRKEVNSMTSVTPHFAHPSTLQASIIKRMFGDDKKYETFLGNYRKSRKTARYDRSEWLSRPLTEEEHTMLYEFLHETDTAVTEIGRNHNMKSDKVHAAVLKLCARYLYQNQKLMK